MASVESDNVADHEVELIVHDASATLVPSTTSGVVESVQSADKNVDSDEIAPLLAKSGRPKINIFTFPYRRRNPTDQIIRLSEADQKSLVTQFMSWVWSGSRYSGLVCMALSSTIYFVMEVLSQNFTGYILEERFQSLTTVLLDCVHAFTSVPLFETALSRCTIILILSYVWLRKCGQTISGVFQIKSLLILRAVFGYLSLWSFIYCIQKLPLSQAIVLNLTMPIMASVSARIILHEKLKLAEMGGLACSFFGVLFIFRQITSLQGNLVKSGERSNRLSEGGHLIYAILVGLFSSATGGISYCLVRGGAKVSDQPLSTVFSFGMLACPAAAICTFVFEGFVLPGIFSCFLMFVLGVLAFLAEVLLARGLQLEKTSRASNIIYIEVALSQLCKIGLLQVAPSFGRLVGCLLIIVSACSTIYMGPDKEIDE